MSLQVGGWWKENMNLTWSEVFEETCEKHPDKEAIIHSGSRVTYKEYAEKVSEIARGLYELGVRPGDHVALWMTNRPEWAFVRFAICKLGAVMIPLNTLYKSEEIEFVLGNSDARVLIMEDSFFGTIPALEMLKQISPEIEAYKPGHLKLEKFPLLRAIVTLGNQHPGCLTFEELLFMGRQNNGDFFPERRAKDVSHIMYTSGTTGFPKGVMTPNSNFLALCTLIGEMLRIKPGDRYLACTPFFGNIALTIQSTCVTHGATLIITDKFEPKAFMELIEKERIKCTIVVPTILIDILEHPEFNNYNLSSLEYAIVGGAVVPMKLINQARKKTSLEIINAYGLCEASGLSTWTPVGDTPEHIEKTIGIALPNCEVSIRNPQNNEEVAVGEEGEICSKEVIPGSQHMKGYYKQPELTKETIRDGWLHSGDLGRQREDGYFEIKGRVKEMLIVGGFNVSPSEIEQYILSHPMVENVAIVGVPDHRLGEVGVAFVKLNRGQMGSEDEIIAYCKDKLANYKVPRYVFFTDKYPLNPQGKIQKFKLRDQAVAALNLQKAE